MEFYEARGVDEIIHYTQAHIQRMQESINNGGTPASIISLLNHTYRYIEKIKQNKLSELKQIAELFFESQNYHQLIEKQRIQDEQAFILEMYHAYAGMAGLSKSEIPPARFAPLPSVALDPKPESDPPLIEEPESETAPDKLQSLLERFDAAKPGEFFTENEMVQIVNRSLAWAKKARSEENGISWQRVDNRIQYQKKNIVAYLKERNKKEAKKGKK